MDETSKLFDRIRKLLAKAEATEHEGEAQAFFDKAMGYMVENDIDRAQLGELNKSGPAPIERRILSRKQLCGSLPYSIARSEMLMLIAKVMGCRCYYSGGRTAEFTALIGTAANIDKSVMLFQLAQQQMDRALLNEHPGPWESPKVFRRNFIESFGRGFAEKLRKAQAVTFDRDASKGGTAALALRSDRQRASDWVEQEGLHLTTTRTSRQGSHAGSSAGREAGRNADVGSGRLGSRRALNA